MDQLINLVLYLIIAFIGFIVPIIGILISLFPDSLKKLTLQYENEKKQNEDNIEDAIKKRKENKDLDIKLLEKNLKVLKRNKKKSKEKLSYLNPKSSLLRVLIPPLISFILLSVALLSNNTYIIYITFGLGVLAFIPTLYAFWKLLGVLTEAFALINDEKASSNSKIIELLSTLVEKTPDTPSPFLKPELISVKINNRRIVGDIKFPFSVNKKHSLSIAIVNSDELMAKNIELGFIFPLDFLVETTSNISSIYTGKDNQIIRFDQPFIQPSETNHQGSLNITFLKQGIHTIELFIKGENVKPIRKNFIIKIIP